MDNHYQYTRHPFAPISHTSAHFIRYRCVDNFPASINVWQPSITNAAQLAQSQAFTKSSVSQSNNSTIISPLLNLTLEEKSAAQGRCSFRQFEEEEEQVYYLYDTPGISQVYMRPAQKLYYLLYQTESISTDWYQKMNEKPTWFEVQFFRKAWKYYDAMYDKITNSLQKQQKIIQQIFGQSSKYLKNFIQTHIKNQQPLFLAQTSISKHQQVYYKNSQTFMQQMYSKSKLAFLGQFKELSGIKLPLQFFVLARECMKLRVHYGDDQLQGLFNMSRTFGQTYRFKILGNSLAKSQLQRRNRTQAGQLNKRVLIKCDIMQQKRNLLNYQGSKSSDNSSSNVTMKLYELVELSSKQSAQSQNNSNKLNELMSLKLIFYTQICSQLIEYELLTGRQYPQLNPVNILYNLMTKSFTLSPQPIMYENLAVYQIPQLPMFTVNKRNNSSNTYTISKRTLSKQANFEKQFSLNGLIQTSNPNSNAMRFILLLYYIEHQSFNLQLSGISKQSAHINDIGFWCKLFNLQQEEILKQLTHFNNNQVSSYNLLDQRYLTMGVIAQFLKAQNMVCFPTMLFFNQVLLQSNINFDFDLSGTEHGPRNKNALVNVSSLSGGRYENLLYTRFKIIHYLLKKLTQTHDILASPQTKQQQKMKASSAKLQLPSNVSSEQVQVLKNQLFRCLLVYHVLECITGLELLELTKKQDYFCSENQPGKLLAIWKQMDELFSAETIANRTQQLTKIQAQSKSWNNLAAELVYLINKLANIYKINKECMMNQEVYNTCNLPHAMYSKLFYKIINYNCCCSTNSSSLKNDHPQLFCEKCEKCYRSIWENNNQKDCHTLRFICQVYRIVNALLLKMDDKNLMFSEYKIYRRMKEFMKKKQTNGGILTNLQDQVHKMDTGTDGAAQGKFWGFLWPKSQEDFGVMSNFYDQNNKNGNIVLEDNELNL